MKRYNSLQTAVLPSKRTAILTLLFSLLSLLPLSLHAQEHYSRAAIAYEVKVIHYVNEESDIPKGIALAYTHGFPLTQKAPLFIEAGAKLGWTHDVSNYRPDEALTVRRSFLDISLPVDLTYRFSLFNNNFCIAPSTGPNFRFNLVSKEKYTYGWRKSRHSEKINLLSRDEAYPAAIFQFGWRLGLALSHGPFHICYNFTYDLTYYRDVMSLYCETVHFSENRTSTHPLAFGYTF